MKDFDKIIGYASIKKDLERIADILKDSTSYTKLGVKLPKGLLLHGEPGVGKTLMANCLADASGRAVFICRKNQPDGEFVNTIKSVFAQAVNGAPSIVFLDDLDKFANEDEEHRDAEEYVTVQSCIDELSGANVFVLATANDVGRLPSSLLRAGRFDRIIEVPVPLDRDAILVTEHFLQNKCFAHDVEATYIARLMHQRSCAELETVLNEAGLYAGYEHAESITLQHFMEAYLRTICDIPVAVSVGEENSVDLTDYNCTKTQVVYHEAGHAVVAEILSPGSVTLVSTNGNRGEIGGYTAYYHDKEKNLLKSKQARIVAALGGMAAIELKFGLSDAGVTRDLDHAFEMTRDLVTNLCVSGFSLHRSRFEDSDAQKHKQEQAVAVEVERYYRQAKEILTTHKAFLEEVAQQLARTGYLTALNLNKIKDTSTSVLYNQPMEG